MTLLKRRRTIRLGFGRRSLGVDLGGGALKFAQIRWTRTGPRLERAAVVPITNETPFDEEAEDPETLGRQLRVALTDAGASAQRSGICIGGPAVVTRLLHVPAQKPREIQAAMAFEAPHQLPIPQDQLIHDCDLVPDAPQSDGLTPVFLVGTNRTQVETVCKIMAAAELQPQFIEPDSIAAFRTLQWLGLTPYVRSQPMGILDVGETDTRLMVMEYGVPVLEQRISAGIRQLRKLVVEQLGVPMPDAEVLLQDRGVQDQELAPAVAPWLELLLESAGQAVGTFLRETRGVVLERIYLLGGGAALPGLAQVLTSHLLQVVPGRLQADRFQARPVDFAGLEMDPTLQGQIAQIELQAPLLTTALGCALREGAPR